MLYLLTLCLEVPLNPVTHTLYGFLSIMWLMSSMNAKHKAPKCDF